MPELLVVENPFKNLDPNAENVERVFGLESEYGTHPFELLGDFMNFLPKALVKRRIYPANNFYSNGARIYSDCQHLEYATPETLSLRELVGSIIAGEELVVQLAEDFSSGHKVRRISFDTGVVNEHGTTYGSHENYLIAADANIIGAGLPRAEQLLGHLVGRLLFCGAGVVTEDGDGYSFGISQKALGVNEAVNSKTTGGSKPLINTRDEAHARNMPYKRLHIVGGDPTMLPWATAFRFGSTSLVVRMLEHGVDLGPVALGRVTNGLLVNATDYDNIGKETIELKSGKKYRLIDINKFLVTVALKFAAKVELPKDEETVLEEWVSAIEDFEKDPSGHTLAGRVDWATKHANITRREVRNNRPCKYSEAKKVDYSWGELGPNGTGRKARSTRHAKDPLGSVELASRLQTSAPRGRSRQRSNIIKAAHRSSRVKITSIDWGRINYVITNPVPGAKDLSANVMLDDPKGSLDSSRRAYAFHLGRIEERADKRLSRRKAKRSSK